MVSWRCGLSPGQCSPNLCSWEAVPKVLWKKIAKFPLVKKSSGKIELNEIPQCSLILDCSTTFICEYILDFSKRAAILWFSVSQRALTVRTLFHGVHITISWSWSSSETHGECFCRVPARLLFGSSLLLHFYFSVSLSLLPAPHFFFFFCIFHLALSWQLLIEELCQGIVNLFKSFPYNLSESVMDFLKSLLFHYKKIHTDQKKILAWEKSRQ